MKKMNAAAKNALYQRMFARPYRLSDRDGRLPVAAGEPDFFTGKVASNLDGHLAAPAYDAGPDFFTGKI